LPATFVPRTHDDGSLRIDLTLTHSLTALDLVQLLCSAHRTTALDSLPLHPYTALVHTLRTELRERGALEPFRWRTALTETGHHARADALETWARAEVTRLFPALGPPN
jgi:hypothetical protein